MGTKISVERRVGFRSATTFRLPIAEVRLGLVAANHGETFWWPLWIRSASVTPSQSRKAMRICMVLFVSDKKDEFGSVLRRS